MSENRFATVTDATSVSRRDLVTGTVGLIIAGVSGAAAAASETRGKSPLGTQAGVIGLGFMAQVDQVGPALTVYGYLTLVNGLSLEQLYFPGAERSEATARFTFHGTASVDSLQSHDTLRVANASGRFEYFMRDLGGASFDSADSFAQGQLIATDDASMQNVLNVTAPNTAVTTVYADLTRTTVNPFDVDGHRYQLGRMGLRSRLEASGKGVRTEPTTPRACAPVYVIHRAPRRRTQ
jgi:hypothetical protein